MVKREERQKGVSVELVLKMEREAERRGFRTNLET